MLGTKTTAQQQSQLDGYKLTFDFGAAPEDVDDLMRAQRDCVRKLLRLQGYDTEKWTSEQFNSFVLAVTTNCLVQTSMWGIRRAMAADGCTDDLGVPYD